MCQKIKDSGSREEFDTGAVRDIQENKGRFDLLPWSIIDKLYPVTADYLDYGLWQLAIHFDKGAQKYAARNWEQGIPVHVYYNSAMRHLIKIKLSYTDEPHLPALTWNLVCMLWTMEGVNNDQLPPVLCELPFPVADVIDYNPNVREQSLDDCHYHLVQFFIEKNFSHIVSAARAALGVLNES